MENNPQGEVVSQVRMRGGNLLPKGQGGVDGGVMGIGRERPLLLPLLDESLPSFGILALNIGTLPHGRPLPFPTTLPTPLLLTVMGPLPALPLVSHFQVFYCSK